MMNSQQFTTHPLIIKSDIAPTRRRRPLRLIRRIVNRSMAKKPRLIVFDLDYTLWPFYVDCSVTPPFRKTGRGEITDSLQRPVTCYKDVPAVLEDLYSAGYQLAIASRTGETDGANHRFRQSSGIEYKDMLFFDDENRNITDIRSLGVTCIWVENGINKSLVEEGLKRFAG